MALYVTSINSGSNGNCYYIGNDTEAVLIDAGISCRETERRMKLLNLDMGRVKAIFISHEHTDHIRGLASLTEKYALPVYVTTSTAKGCGKAIPKSMAKEFKAHEAISVGNLSITAFPKYHDAADPHSFIVSCNEITIGVFTDIGRVCQHLRSYFTKCSAAFLEANYDEQLLEKGSYPFYLKNRIRGGRGHLSNPEAVDIFIKYRAPHLSHLFLSHLSQENNSEEIVRQLFNSHAGNTEIVIAGRHEPTAVYKIHGQINTKLQPAVQPFRRPVQMELF